MSFGKQVIKNSPIHKGVKDLINYDNFTKTNSKSNKKYSKFIIELNFLTFNIIKQSNYHYNFLILHHRNLLPNSQLHLLYNYLCLQIILRAKFFTEITLSELLTIFWPTTNNSSTKRTRKQAHFIFFFSKNQE
uniref:Uncharacterized protein n=1 Tax=Phyllymenia taiwanensis TaxID=1260292 RepID=R9XXU2_9FLOR|nr:hypothetical protein [Grateloupia taiwanensis]AGO19804.1 hypothetical protein [Grateloupia taiwanensis]